MVPELFNIGKYKMAVYRERNRAGDEGIEPPTAVLETAVMPLN